MKNIDKLLLHRILKGIADSIIKIFIPVLIYKVTGNIFYCFINVVLDYFLTGLGFIFLKKIMRGYAKVTLLFSILPLIVSEVFLLMFNINLPIIIVIAILDAIYTSLYFGSLNYLFLSMDNSTNTSKFETGHHLGQIIFTLISAYILGNVADSFTFMVCSSIVIYICSIIPIILLCKDKNIEDDRNYTTKEILKRNIYYNFYHAFTGIFSFMCDVCLPLYLYIKGLSFTVVGIFMALQYSIRIVANYLAKSLNKHNLEKLTVLLGSLLIFISFTSILFIDSRLIIYIFNLIITFSYQLLFVSMFDKFVKEQKENGMYKDSIFHRDVFQNSARVVAGSLYFVIPSFTVMFIFGIASSVGIGLFGAKISS